MRALVIDDSRAMRSILGQMLSHLDFEVLEAADGDEAMRLLTSGPLPDVILLDWNMPAPDGYATLLAIRASAGMSRVPVIMVSTETELAQMAKALAAGADEYVMKPFTRDVLESKLHLLGLREVA